MIDEVVDIVSSDPSSLGDTCFVANAGSAYCDGLMALARGVTIDVVDVATQATRRRLPCDAKAAVLAWGPGRRLACGTPGLARVFVHDCVSNAPLDGRVTSAAFATSSNLVAFCTVKACTVFEDDQLRARLCDLPGVWRGCAFAQDALCAVADAGAHVWEPGKAATVVHGTAGARCAAALDATFVVACDARLSVVAPAATQTLQSTDERRGEVSFSGFGGGIIPPAFILGAETVPPPSLAHILIVARDDDDGKENASWTVVRKVAVDALGPDTKLLDLLAVSDAFIFVASTFARKVARFDAATLAASAVVQVPARVRDSATGTTRLRGLAPALPGTCCAVLADAAAGGPKNSSSPTRAFIILDVFGSPSRAPPDVPTEDSVDKEHRQDGDPVAALRAHVDRRLDALEAKLDRLLLLAAQ